MNLIYSTAIQEGFLHCTCLIVQYFQFSCPLSEQAISIQPCNWSWVWNITESKKTFMALILGSSKDSSRDITKWSGFIFGNVENSDLHLIKSNWFLHNLDHHTYHRQMFVRQIIWIIYTISKKYYSQVRILCSISYISPYFLF